MINGHVKSGTSKINKNACRTQSYAFLKQVICILQTSTVTESKGEYRDNI